MFKKILVLVIAVLAFLVLSIETTYAEENTSEIIIANTQQTEASEIIALSPPRTITVNNVLRPDRYSTHTQVPSTWIHTIYTDGLQYRGTLRLQRTERQSNGLWAGYYSGTLTGRPMP